MCRYTVNQHLIVLNSSHGIYYFEIFKKSKFDVKFVNTVKQNIRKQIDCVQNEYKINEQSTKYSNCNIQIEI